METVVSYFPILNLPKTTVWGTQVIMDLFTFTTEILNGKFVFTAMNILVHEILPNFASNIEWS